MSVERMMSDPRVQALLRKYGVRAQPATHQDCAFQLAETGIGPVLTADVRGKMADELSEAMDEIRKEERK